LHVSENNIVRATAGEAVVSGISHNGMWTIDAQEIQIEPRVTLRGAFFRKPGSTATVLYFGGNGFVLSKHYRYLLSIYEDLPVDVIAFDHRGYGGSTGTAELDALMKDGLLIHDHVKSLSTVSAKPLIVHGHSLGSFVAGNIARHRTLDGLVLESSATSTEEWAQGFTERTRWIRKVVTVVPDLSLQGKGNSGVMATLNEPILIVVGRDDTTTRPEMSEALFEQAAVPGDWKELLVVEGAHHMNASRGTAYREAFLRLAARAASRIDERQLSRRSFISPKTQVRTRF
ncbi:MAG: lysophospholipase, partial [Corynebacterium casei]|nr:lysophospholipase [Corynebacterium casei]